MRRFSLVLAAVLILSAGAIWAQKHVTSPRTPPPRMEQPQKYVQHPVTRAPSGGSRPGHNSLDALYPSVDVPKNIPDGGVVTSTLNIPDNVTINDLNVHVAITHPWMRDLQVSLSAPGDTFQTMLFDTLPWDSLQNMDGWFNDAAGLSVFDADTPLVCTWRPYDSLSHYDGRSAQGTWTLRVRDRFYQDIGTLDAWGIDVNPTPMLTGTVINNATGAPVRNAIVEALGTCYSGVTNDSGRFAFLQLLAGTYSFRFSKYVKNEQWYDTTRIDNVVIDPANPDVLDAGMNTLPNKYEYAYFGPPVAIVDADTERVNDTLRYITTVDSMNLNVADDFFIGDVRVLVNINHTYDEDLLIYLSAPNYDSIIVLAQNVGSYGDNFVNCLFDDSADTPISQGTAPFTGSYRPQTNVPQSGHLHSLRNTSPLGIWTLYVIDGSPGDSGVIRNFTLEIRSASSAIVPHVRPSVPQEFAFVGNYPNPFNGETQFQFDLARRGRIELVLYNTLGQRVADIVQGNYDAGAHVAPFNSGGLASGLYVARLTFDHAASQSRKVLLLK